ncbi:MAG: hypothetical protein HKN88_09545 [Gammaproteobacteria bacterium]|nr:hypothetical protein [Gammaproteobacteria bacterium]NNC98300.1 hypothetical protein [Gammaproteobacteria bacterium]
MTNIPLKCNCGQVEGLIENVTPSLGNRLNCYCDDCQTFARHLGEDKSILDEYGGTDIVQLPISSIKITQGLEHLQCLRLTPKGLYRWYTGCCKTPIGNTVSSRVPFIGLIHNFVDMTKGIEALFGPVYGAVQTKSAKPGFVKSDTYHSELRTTLRFLFKIMVWKMKGLTKPNVFFQDNGHTIIKTHILE